MMPPLFFSCNWSTGLTCRSAVSLRGLDDTTDNFLPTVPAINGRNLLHLDIDRLGCVLTRLHASLVSLQYCQTALTKSNDMSVSTVTVQI